MKAKSGSMQEKGVSGACDCGKGSSIVLRINIFKMKLIIITYNWMGKEGEMEQSHKKYSKISLKVRVKSMQKRQILIEAVIGKGKSLTRTAKKLNIKLSTAKLILRKYRKTGVLFNKNMSARGRKSQMGAGQLM